MNQHKVLKMILAPCVNFAMRQRLSVQEFVEVAKALFVQSARRELEQSGKPVTASALSIATGMRRGDVGYYAKSDVETMPSTLNITSKALGAWRQDRRFRTRSGEPRVLSFEGQESEFAALVRSVSGHVHHASVLSELKRMRTVEETSEGLCLKREIFTSGADVEEGFSLLTRDLDGMIKAVEENMLNRQSVSNLHITTEYDNISRSRISEIRRWFLDEGKAFHRRMREFLSQFDRDISPESDDESEGVRVLVGTFSFTPPLEDGAPSGNSGQGRP